MNKLRLLSAISASALAFSLSNSAAAAWEAFTIDNFDADTRQLVYGEGVNVPVESEPNDPEWDNIVMNRAEGWTRYLTAELTYLTPVDPENHRMITVVCPGCNAGHVSMINVEEDEPGDANGIGTYTYVLDTTDPDVDPVDLSGYPWAHIDWGANLPGARVDIIAMDDTGESSIVASWSNLASTGGSSPDDLVPQAAVLLDWGDVNSSAVVQIEVEVTGVTRIRTIIDNVSLVSEQFIARQMQIWDVLTTDTDGDGVSNDDDECPDTPSAEDVDLMGCSAMQFCNQIELGGFRHPSRSECGRADWQDNENSRFPLDCKIVRNRTPLNPSDDTCIATQRAN